MNTATPTVIIRTNTYLTARYRFLAHSTPTTITGMGLADLPNTSQPNQHLYDSLLINRLRIGYTRLTNSYLLKGESQPVCEACHSPLTVKHILVDCTRYSAARQRYFGVATLKDVFENVASCNTIGFVRNINFYNRI